MLRLRKKTNMLEGLTKSYWRLTIKVLRASFYQPQISQAVKINGEQAAKLIPAVISIIPIPSIDIIAKAIIY